MDALARPILQRLPLAEAVLLVWSYLAEEHFLQDLFQRHRQRCYEKVITFPLLVQLIADALLAHGGSAHQCFAKAIEEESLAASVQAAYGKLRRLPIPLSMAFLAGCSDRLRPLFPPVTATPLPESLKDWQVVVYDGKALKRVAKRLKPLRGIAGGLLGGRALVALDLRSGLTVAMHAHADGDANDVRFVPLLLPAVRQRIPGPRLHLADRQFCDLKRMAEFTEGDDHFLVRYHPKVHFYRDETRAVQQGQDERGRHYREEWGWVGSPQHRQRRYVRRITLFRPGEEDIILVTDVLEAEDYPATDLLAVYLARWGIERMFQQVTEVFGLEGLIGSTPEATVFQFAFCLVLYNLIQVVRGYVAEAEQRPPATISAEKLFDDVTQELTAWNKLIAPATTVALFAEVPPQAELCRRLRGLLGAVWTERWRKAPTRKRRPPGKQGKRTHGSVYRILEDHRRRQKRAQ